MRLVLKVLMSPDGCGLEGQANTFEEAGGSFGRGPANQWILPDPSRHISSVHGKVVYEGGQFQLRDESTNGIYLNDEEFPIGQGNQVPLGNGDQIAFGEYILEVDIEAQAELTTETLVPGFADNTPTPTPPSAKDDFDDLDRWLDPAPASAPSSPASAPMGSDPFASDPLSSGKLDDDLMGAPASPSSQDPLAALASAGNPQNDFGQPQQPSTQGNDNFSLDDLLGSPAPEQAAPEYSANQASMDLNKIVKSSPQDFDASLNETMINPIEESESAPSAPLVDDTPPSIPEDVFTAETPELKDENSLADELDSFLSGAELKSEITAPETAIVDETPPPPAKAESMIQDQEPQIKSLLDEEPLIKEEVPAPAPTPEPVVAAKPIEQSPPLMPQEQIVKVQGDANHILAEKLGLDDLPPSSMAMLSDNVAEVVKESVKGLMLNLRARNQVKSEFRLNMTMIQAAENNPLKFSVTPEDGMENMFAKPGKAYLPPVEAVEDSFADIGDHQVALFDAMRSAYDHMLDMFNPETIASRNPSTKSRGFLGGKKDAHWEQYKAFYERLMEDREQTFKRSFGEVFAEAYERRMQELKIARIKK